jgi:D-alanyl-D-alanine carboxypeptidase
MAVAAGGLLAAPRPAGDPGPPSGPAATPRPAAPSSSPSPSPSPSPALPSPPPSAVPSVPVERLEAILDDARGRLGIPGLSATVIWPDGAWWTGTSGVADFEADRLVTADTAFGVASITKMFVAALILQLVEEGRLSLDDRVADLLPDAAVDEGVTVLMLLDHTSGVRDFFYHPLIDRALLSDRGRVWTPAQTLRYVGKPYFRPGRGWHYSNTNYLLLGLLAERVTGRSLADELRERFFDPLGLRTAHFQVVEAPRGPIARGYRFTTAEPDEDPVGVSDGTPVMPFISVVTAAGGAGGVAASSGDLARWAVALFGGEVLEPATLALMLADVDRTARYRPRVPYGLGVQRVVIDGWVTYGHSGRLLGARGAVRYLTGQRIAIAVLTNQSRADVGPIVAALLEASVPSGRSCPACGRPS